MKITSEKMQCNLKTDWKKFPGPMIKQSEEKSVAATFCLEFQYLD